MKQRRLFWIAISLLAFFICSLSWSGFVGGGKAKSHSNNPITRLSSNDKVIDLMQVQFLDFLNGEADLTDRNATFGGSISKNFNYKEAFKHIHSYSKRIPAIKYDIEHFHQMALRARALFISYRILHEASPTLQSELAAVVTPGGTVKEFTASLNDAVNDLTQVLYPWINPPYSSIINMQLSFLQGASVGIAFTCGTRQFYMTQHAIISLREVWNIHLPIEVFYAGSSDLHPFMVDALNKMKNVKAINILDIFSAETHKWGGWSLKPFAILAASFRTVLFMDADVLFLKDPREVLKSKLFRKNGHLFYRDRKLREEGYVKGTVWLNELNPHMSRYGRSLSYTNLDPSIYSTTHQMESGFIPVDKGRSGVLFSLLMACRMNAASERNAVLYRYTYGDKEAFWFSAEMMRVPYAFNPSHGGVIGGKDDGRSKNGWSVVCGVWLLHIDEKEEPFWWNGGGVLRYRDASKDFEFVDFSHYASHKFKGDLNVNQWIGPGHCLNQSDSQVHALSPALVKLMDKYKDIFRNQIKEIVLPPPEKKAE
ncbi:mannosyltransferase putative-domain-containing protein [Obelidium mucronatum]|nr:mannosyltransferase putative-domain-containing protein [Obelidium mucronatum]